MTASPIITTHLTRSRAVCVAQHTLPRRPGAAYPACGMSCVHVPCAPTRKACILQNWAPSRACTSRRYLSVSLSLSLSLSLWHGRSVSPRVTPTRRASLALINMLTCSLPPRRGWSNKHGAHEKGVAARHLLLRLSAASHKVWGLALWGLAPSPPPPTRMPPSPVPPGDNGGGGARAHTHTRARVRGER